jgi:hypothetical protein
MKVMTRRRMRGWPSADAGVVVLLGALAIAAACSSRDPSFDSHRPTGSGATGAGAGGGGAASAGGGGNGDGGAAGDGGTGGLGPRFCQQRCDSVKDCVGPGPTVDEDNFSCVGDGATPHCVYGGCNDDAECMTLGDYVCRDGAAPPTMLAPVPACVRACKVPGDCDLGGGVAYDADNYACPDGGCVYTGCNNDTECASLGNYVCRDLGTGISFCQIACETAADCDLGAGAAYDADNYECTDGVCHYISCYSTAECQTVGDYVCVGEPIP